MIRQHQVTLQVSPHLYLDHNRRVVLSVDVISLSEAKARGWIPILIYGVCCSVTKLKAVRLAASDEPTSIMDALLEIWRDDHWMKGVPDEVVVCPELASSVALCDSLAKLGIGVTLGNRKSYAINRRLIGNEYNYFYGRFRGVAESVQELNSNSKFWLGELQASRRTMTEGWESLPYQEPPESISPHAIDWAYGPWVEVGFTNAIGMEGTERLTKSAADPVYRIQPSSQSSSPVFEFELGHLVVAWPGRHARLAREIGVSESRLRAYIRGRDEALDLRERRLLVEKLALEDEGGYLDVQGPYLLTPPTPRAADLAWSAVSHGGDLEFGFEVVNRGGEGDPNWHILLGRAFRGNLFIFLIPREAELLPARWRNKMINLMHEPWPLSAEEFRSITKALPTLITGTNRLAILQRMERKLEKALHEMASCSS